MPTHVALVRGVNVGGRGRLPMADLRRVVEGLGHEGVSTYLQSGNVLVTAPDRADRADRADPPEPAALADELRRAVRRELDLDVGVVVLTAAQWREIMVDEPFRDEPDDTLVHALIRQDPVPAGHRRAAEDLRDELAAAGSPDDLAVVGRTIHLHVPAGLGRSRLAERLSRGRACGGDLMTARNRRTVRALADRLDAGP